MSNQFNTVYLFTDTYAQRNDVKIYVSDIIDYYITTNHSKIETLEHFNISNTFLSKIIKQYKIKKPRLLSHEHNKKTSLERYGSETYNNLEKRKQTCLEKYGVENPFQDIEKIKQSYISRYGVDNPNKVKEVREKIEQTCLEKYGETSFSKTKAFNEKCKITSIKHFGTNHPMQSKEIKAKFNFNSIVDKAFETKKKNNTTNTSKPQQLLITSLFDIFGKDNILTEYKDERYPFHCDVYIIPLDMFIELNLYFTHGYNHKIKQPPHLFNKNDENDIELLKEWQEKAKTSQFYQNAIKVWTIKDVEKNNYAKKNNLNYVCIYTLDELNIFLKEIQWK